MSAKEYQDAYRAALFSLKKKHKVGEPYRENGGNRVCVVDSMIATDHTVFRLAWEVKKAGEIKIDGAVYDFNCASLYHSRREDQ
jgi:hypothetical protein